MDFVVDAALQKADIEGHRANPVGLAQEFATLGDTLQPVREYANAMNRQTDLRLLRVVHP